MKNINKILAICLVVVLTYAAGLTIGIGPRKVVTEFKKRLVKPVVVKVLHEGPRLADYVEKTCPNEDVLAIAYFGQSNATNTVEPVATGPFPANLIQYDWRTAKCFDYREPLLGADFTRGNNITYAAVRLAENTNKTVVVIPFGFGPSSVLVWAYGQGALLQDHVLKRLKRSGLSPQVFLWHLGETDVAMDGVDESDFDKVPYFERPNKRNDIRPYREGIPKDLYRDALEVVVQRTLDAFPDTHIGVALVSIAPCLGRDDIWQPVRDAEQEVIDSNPRVFMSADSDKIRGIENRYDTCHFSADGARKLSDEYYRSIMALGLF